MNRNIFLPAMVLGLLATQTRAQSGYFNERTSSSSGRIVVRPSQGPLCFSRYYEDGHVSRHPKQLVRSFFWRLSSNSTFNVNVAAREYVPSERRSYDVRGIFSNNGGCRYTSAYEATCTTVNDSVVKLIGRETHVTMEVPYGSGFAVVLQGAATRLRLDGNDAINRSFHLDPVSCL